MAVQTKKTQMRTQCFGRGVERTGGPCSTPRPCTASGRPKRWLLAWDSRAACELCSIKQQGARSPRVAVSKSLTQRNDGRAAARRNNQSRAGQLVRGVIRLDSLERVTPCPGAVVA